MTDKVGKTIRVRLPADFNIIDGPPLASFSPENEEACKRVFQDAQRIYSHWNVVSVETMEISPKPSYEAPLDTIQRMERL